MSFEVGEKVWAKLPGYPHWPARIEIPRNVRESKKIPAGAYLIFFYGTHQTAVVVSEELFIWNDENREKFGMDRPAMPYFADSIYEVDNDPDVHRDAPLPGISGLPDLTKVSNYNPIVPPELENDDEADSLSEVKEEQAVGGRARKRGVKKVKDAVNAKKKRSVQSHKSGKPLLKKMRNNAKVSVAEQKLTTSDDESAGLKRSRVSTKRYVEEFDEEYSEEQSRKENSSQPNTKRSLQKAVDVGTISAPLNVVSPVSQLKELQNKKRSLIELQCAMAMRTAEEIAVIDQLIEKLNQC